MLLPILPFFLVYVLNSPIVVVGLIEGLAVFAQAVVQPLSSHFVRTARARKRGGLAGYSTTTVAHGLLALATMWPVVLILRVTAWSGRGWRQPIKKTILSNSTDSAHRGASFGLEQAFDSVGAVLGTFGAIALLLYAGLAGSSRDIFALSVIPGLVAVLVFSLKVREKDSAPARPDPLAPELRSEPLPARFKWFLVGSALFGLGFFNILLAVLDIGQGVQLPHAAGGGGLDQTQAVVLALVVYLLYNLVYAGASFPFGRLADRRPGIHLVALSYLLFLPVDLLLILSGGILGAVILMAGAGLQIALLDTVESTWISRAVPDRLVGKAFGWFGGLRGFAVLVGSILVAAVWEYISANLAFALSAIFIVAATGILLLAVKDPQGPPVLHPAPRS